MKRALLVLPVLALLIGLLLFLLRPSQNGPGPNRAEAVGADVALSPAHATPDEGSPCGVVTVSGSYHLHFKPG